MFDRVLNTAPPFPYPEMSPFMEFYTVGLFTEVSSIRKVEPHFPEDVILFRFPNNIFFKNFEKSYLQGEIILVDLCNFKQIPVPNQQ